VFLLDVRHVHGTGRASGTQCRGQFDVLDGL